MDIEDLGYEVEDLLSLTQEVEEGNREYKEKIVNPERLMRLRSQLSWRLTEGGGECFHFIGFNDDGSFKGLSPDEDETSITLLKKVCDMSDATCTLLQEIRIDELVARKFLIRENNTIGYINLRVGILGQVDAGKSTIVGVLSSGILDNGKGLARTQVFNFRHEFDTGRTSSVSQRIVGFGPGGEFINTEDEVREKTWKEITKKSSKVVTFHDLCGHESYLHTTIAGISSANCDYAMIMVSASDGIPNGAITREHIILCATYRIPFIIIITKIDQVKDNRERLLNTISEINELVRKLPDKRRIISPIDTRNDLIDSLEGFQKGVIVPLMQCSSVTGYGLDNIKMFLNLASPRLEFDPEGVVRLNVIETYMPKGVGLVVGGFLQRGTIKAGNSYMIGPNRNGEFKHVKVRSIEVKRVRVTEAKPGAYVCLGIPKLDRQFVKRGMVITSDTNVKSMTGFRANIFIREKKSITINPGYEAIAIFGSFRSAARVIKINDYEEESLKQSKDKIGTIDDPVKATLKVGDRANVLFKLMHRPCYIEKKERVIFTQGKIRMLGIVTDVEYS